MNWIEDNPNSALHRLYKKQRRTVIISLCNLYDAFWVRNNNDQQVLIEHQLFDLLKLSNGDLEKFRNTVSEHPLIYSRFSSPLVDEAMGSSVDPYAIDWNFLDSPLHFSPANWGDPKKHPFAKESDEINLKIDRAIIKLEDSYEIQWENC